MISREKYPHVKQNIEEYINSLVEENHKKQLEEWCGLQCKDLLFDSSIDSWINTSTLNKKIIGKKELIFLIESEDNELFCYYLNTEIEIQTNTWKKTDN